MIPYAVFFVWLLVANMPNIMFLSSTWSSLCILVSFFGHFSEFNIKCIKKKKSHDNIFHFVCGPLGSKFAKCHVFFLNGSIFSPTLSDYDERNNIILVEKYIIFSRAVMYLKRIFQGGIRPSTICHDVNHSFHLDASH